MSLAGWENTEHCVPHGKSEETNTRKRNHRLGQRILLCWEPRQGNQLACTRGNWTPDSADGQWLPGFLWAWSWPVPSVSIPQGRPNTCAFICIAGYAYIPFHRPQGSTQLKRSSQPLVMLVTPNFPSSLEMCPSHHDLSVTMHFTAAKGARVDHSCHNTTRWPYSFLDLIPTHGISMEMPTCALLSTIPAQR